MHRQGGFVRTDHVARGQAYRRRLSACLFALLVSGALVAPPGALADDLTGLLLVSRSSSSTGAVIDPARAGALSANGRYATFGGNGGYFVRDLRTARTRRIDAGGAATFASGARLLASGRDGRVFVLNLLTGAKIQVSGPNSSLRGRPSISADGRYVAFEGVHRGPFDEDGDGNPGRSASQSQIYLRDLKTGRTRLISRASGAGGVIGDRNQRSP